MKQIAIPLMLLLAITLQAQQIENGSMWYNGALVYTATPYQVGKIVMSSTVEGEELEFMLVPTGEADTYRIENGPNDAMMVHEVGTIVKHIVGEGIDVLGLYNDEGRLATLMVRTDEGDCQPLNIERFMRQVRGTYTLKDGTRVTIDWDKANVGGYYMPIEPQTFNGQTTGILHFDGDKGKPLNGYLEVAQSIDGLVLYPVAFDDMDFPHRLLVDSIALTESDPNNGRFDYASHELLYGSDLYNYDPPLLRLMRNSILARHGYVFQSRDLQEYFGKEPWYKPGDSNENIQLSLLERLNIEIIQNTEKEIKKELEANP